MNRETRRLRKPKRRKLDGTPEERHAWYTARFNALPPELWARIPDFVAELELRRLPREP